MKCDICNALVMDASGAVSGLPVAHVHHDEVARPAGLVSPRHGRDRHSGPASAQCSATQAIAGSQGGQLHGVL